MSDFPLSEPEYSSKRTRDLTPFIDALDRFSATDAARLNELLSERTIPQIQALMAAGLVSSEALTLYYLDRFRRYDLDSLNAILELNPDALNIAREMDARRGRGQLQDAMHGIPVLIKDNIATGDRTHTTAGAYALRNWHAPRDAFLVRQLRATGAVVLGKSNLSEWANWMDPSMPNGFSTLGGQTRSPYGPFDPSGSSSGSAVAVAADLVTVAVGTETRGSIISPGEANSIVALKTSLGLVSRDYIVPLVDWLDVPGPMARSVTDVAVLLSAMTGTDASDPATARASALAGTDFTQFLDPDLVRGKRIGLFGEEEVELAHQLTSLGLETVRLDPARLPEEPEFRDLLSHGMKRTLNEWLDRLGADAPVASLAEVIEINNHDLANRAPYGQGRLIGAQENRVTDAEYAEMVAKGRAMAEAMHALFEEMGVDLLLGNGQPAVYATAGFPAITVPAGYAADGRPQALKLMADYLGEPLLIAAGYAFEQATRARQAPDLDGVVASFAGLHSAP